MSGATSRFITIEIGKRDDEKLATVFNMAFYEHLGIALIILLISETIGLWFLNTYLVIPEERLCAANWVYQMSIVSMMVPAYSEEMQMPMVEIEEHDVGKLGKVLEEIIYLEDEYYQFEAKGIYNDEDYDRWAGKVREG